MKTIEKYVVKITWKHGGHISESGENQAMWLSGEEYSWENSMNHALER
jgi:hypothetical protein